MPPLEPATEKRIRAEAEKRGVDPDAAVVEAEKHAPVKAAPVDAPASDAPATGAPIADRLLIGFLPFMRVRELRTKWLGLDESLPDDDLTCGEFQAKYGTAGQAGVATTTEPAQ